MVIVLGTIQLYGHTAALFGMANLQKRDSFCLVLIDDTSPALATRPLAICSWRREP